MVKINDRTSAPLWECYYKMSRVAAAIAVQVLSDGVPIDKVSIFGLVLLVEHLDHTKLLKMECDFRNSVCRLTRCQAVFEFDLLLNAVVSCI